MTNKQIEEWKQTHINQTCERLGLTRKEYKRFLILANKLHRINENQCNGYQDINGNWDQTTSDKEEALEIKIQNQIIRMAEEKELYVFFQGDPRGASLYLDNKKIDYNRYTDAYCIY